MDELKPFNLMSWIERHRDFLKPPVCNRQVFRDSEFIVMVVGGPNARTDFHHDEGPEIFYQIEGDMLLRTVQDDRLVDIPIREGEIFLLPPRLHHSPQRFANTIGIVVERQRRPDELDGFIWYCENCGNKLYEQYLHVADIETDLPPVFNRFYDNDTHRTCSACGWVMPPRQG